MPEYAYRAVDQNGIVIKSKLQEKSKQSLIKRLKLNGLTPIDVVQTSFGKTQKVNRNNSNIDDLMKIADDYGDLKHNNKKGFSIKEKINMA